LPLNRLLKAIRFLMPDSSACFADFSDPLNNRVLGAVQPASLLRSETGSDWSLEPAADTDASLDLVLDILVWWMVL
jgi:hypothetical protein